MITAKVKVTGKTESGESDNRQALVSIGPDYADGRNKEWALATPHLSLSMTLNGAVADKFVLGDSFTLQFVKSEE